MVLNVRVYLLTDALKRTETDGRRDITLLGDGRVLGPFSQKCQDSTFQTDSREKEAGLENNRSMWEGLNGDYEEIYDLKTA